MKKGSDLNSPNKTKTAVFKPLIVLQLVSLQGLFYLLHNLIEKYRLDVSTSEEKFLLSED